VRSAQHKNYLLELEAFYSALWKHSKLLALRRFDELVGTQNNAPV